MLVTRKPMHHRGRYVTADKLSHGDLIYLKKMKKHFLISEVKKTDAGRVVIAQNKQEFVELLPAMQVILIEPDYIQLSLF